MQAIRPLSGWKTICQWYRGRDYE